MNIKAAILVSIISVGVFLDLHAQDIERIGQKDALKINGGLSVNQIFYTTSDTIEHRDPYSYYLTGNLNFDLYGWSVPLSYTFSNQKGSFSQPFNQYGLHPRYKWVTTHIGYGSMTFSPYTLNGHLFLGGGVELTPPGKFRFSAMYGRLLKATPVDTTLEDYGEATFKRMGMGFKAGMADDFGSFDIIVFRAADELNSIPYIPDDQELAPQENLVLGISGGLNIIPKTTIKFDIAQSAITEDTRLATSDVNNLYSSLGSIYTPRISSAYYMAMKGNITYNADIFNVGVGYERIAPGYRTLGAYYFNNDLENITVNFATQLFKNKVSFATNAGLQHDNLDDKKLSKMQRLVTSVNVGFTPNERLNFNLGYSNFYSYTHIKPMFDQINQLTPYDNLDTLNFTQLSESANLNVSYLLSKSETRTQQLNVNLSYQVASDQQGQQTELSPNSRFYNVNTGYSMSITPLQLSIVAAVNASYNDADEFSSSTIGPTLGANKSFFERKLRATLSASYNTAYSNGDKQNRAMVVRTGGTYSLKKKHNFNLNLVTSNRKRLINNSYAVTDFTATLGYSFNF